jgi:hypothetical protein
MTRTWTATPFRHPMPPQRPFPRRPTAIALTGLSKPRPDQPPLWPNHPGAPPHPTPPTLPLPRSSRRSLPPGERHCLSGNRYRLAIGRHCRLATFATGSPYLRASRCHSGISETGSLHHSGTSETGSLCGSPCLSETSGTGTRCLLGLRLEIHRGEVRHLRTTRTTAKGSATGTMARCVDRRRPDRTTRIRPTKTGSFPSAVLLVQSG